MSLKGAPSLLVLALALAAGGALADEPERMVVFPVDGELSSSDRRLFDAMLLSDLRRQAALALVPEDVRKVHVEATRSLGLGCASGAPVDAACAAEVGRLAAARWALIGTSQPDREVRLSLVDVESGEVAAEASAVLPPPGDSFTPALRALLPPLLQPIEASRVATDPPSTGSAALSPAVWWISGGALVGVSLLAATGATAAFVTGARQEGPLQAGDDPDARFAARDAWYAGGVTLAVVAGVSLLCGAGLGVYGFLVEDPALE